MTTNTSGSLAFPSTALRLRGRDALPLLHRISTQALLDLTPGHARATLFCDFRGRMLHRAIVALTSDQAVWLLRPDAPGTELAAFVDRHVFREDVKIEDQSSSLRVRLEESTRDAEWVERDGVPSRVSAGDGAALVVEPSGTGDDDVVVEAERRRIRAGQPAHGREIADAFNPYEVGLSMDVHLDKGCYTGQEALQRLITYDSVRRGLARVTGRGAPPAVPADVTRADEKMGVLTSAIAAEESGRWLGLAVLKKELLKGGDAGAGLEVAGGELTLGDPLPATCPLGLPASR